MQVSQLSKPTPVSSQLTLRRGIFMGSAGTGIEHGPAAQQADALLSELRRTLPYLSYAAPWLSYAAPI
jgi:hypothetical protein